MRVEMFPPAPAAAMDAGLAWRLPERNEKAIFTFGKIILTNHVGFNILATKTNLVRS